MCKIFPYILCLHSHLSYNITLFAKFRQRRDYSRKELIYAIHSIAPGDLAPKYDATVHVLCVVDTTKPGIGLGSDPHREDAPGMVVHPEHTVTGMVGDRTTEVIAGDPHQVILDYAKKTIISSGVSQKSHSAVRYSGRHGSKARTSSRLTAGPLSEYHSRSAFEYLRRCPTST